MDNLLDYLDESFFMDFKAHGQGPMIQFVWIYDRDVDLEALHRFHGNLGRGLLGRRIESSPVPFGRSRWVRWSPPADFEVSSRPRPRAELTRWTDEQAALPIDLENGPPWRLAVQPLTEGGAALSLVVAHAVADGLAVNDAITEAVAGTGRDLYYPRPHSRTRAAAFRQDVRQFLRDVPTILKALVLAPLAAREVPLRLRPAPTTAVAVRDHADHLPARQNPARLPSVTILADTAHWDECAERLGGTSNSLLIGVTARLCGMLGWLDADGMVNLSIPVNERTPGDTRGNALSSAVLTVDPAEATDLRGIRAGVKAALTRLTAMRTRVAAPLALTPLIPKFAADRLQTLVMRSANITCSHFGDLNPAVYRPDGADADCFYARHARTPDLADPSLLRRAGGIFFPLASGRLGGRIYANVCYSDAAASTTTEELTAAVRRALDDFGVTAAII